MRRAQDRIDVDGRLFHRRQEAQMSEARSGNPVLPPAMDGREWRIGHSRHDGRASQCVDDLIGKRLHTGRYAIAAGNLQQKSAIMVVAGIAYGGSILGMTPQEIRDEMAALGIGVRELANLASIPENFLTKSLGKAGRRIQHSEMLAIERSLAARRAEIEGPDAAQHEPALPKMPLLGDVPAGPPQEAVEITGKWHPVSDPDTPPRAYALRIKGDSMDKLVPDGATITVDPDDRDLWDGAQYVVRTSDGEATFKEYHANPARLVPLSNNTDHRVIKLGDEPVEILGRVWSWTVRARPQPAV